MLMQHRLFSPINRRYGTWRGMIRSLLGRLELVSGRLDEFRLRQPEQVKRVVFVCLGNICRSSYAHRIALRYGLPVASIGLSTTTGGRSPAQAVAAAARAGVDMSTHRATNLADFDVRPGDLFLVMEVRQAHVLRRRLNGRTDVSIDLLGRWCTPRMPHLHDPFTLSDAYFDTAFARIEVAVHALSLDLAHLTQAAQQVRPATSRPGWRTARYSDNARRTTG